MTSQEYKKKLAASLKRSKNPSRKLLLKEEAENKGYAVDIKTMCGGSVSYFFFKIEDVGSGETSFFISGRENVVAQSHSLDDAFEQLGALKSIGEGE